MEQEKKKERYIRLLDLINNTYKDGDHPPFTPEEKREFGEILADNMTPWEVHCDINVVVDVWAEVVADYDNLNDINLTLEFIGKAGYVAVEGWIRSHGLPLPDREDMIEYLINDIDEEKYINEYHDDILNTLPDYCENSIHDNEIIYLFEIYVDSVDDEDKVICDAAKKLGCVKDECYHAIPHIYCSECDELCCDTRKAEGQMYSCGGGMMNSKKIKELRWHKKVLIDTMNKNGMDVDDIGVDLDNVIDDLDEMRQNETPVKVARSEGFSDGFIMGHMQGKTEGYNEAIEKVSNEDSIHRRIKIKERLMSGSLYYNVYVDEECIGYRFSYDEAIIMGETYITNEVNV